MAAFDHAQCVVAGAGGRDDRGGVDQQVTHPLGERVAVMLPDVIQMRLGHWGKFIGNQRRLYNAGIMACPETRVGPGWEAQFAANHLGHFALTHRLWRLLMGGSRVICVSSSGHHASPMRWDNVQFKRGYDKWLAYGQSKTANALFALHVDHLGREEGIRAFSLHPGKIFTPLQRHLAQEEMVAAGWLDASGAPADPTFKTPGQGAAATVWAATSAQLDGLGGLYCEDCDVAPVAHEATFVGVRPYAVDPGEAERLWTLSCALTECRA